MTQQPAVLVSATDVTHKHMVELRNAALYQESETRNAVLVRQHKEMSDQKVRAPVESSAD